MSKTTSNYGLFIAEGTDIFNPLTQTNSSYEKIDAQMKKNADNSVTNATETKTGTVHALVREVQSASVIRFMATSDYVSGDTFTVDGVVVTTVTTSGESIPDGAFIAGNSVIGVLVNNRLTLYVSVKPTSVEYAQMSANTDKLNGQGSNYYATKSEVESAKEVIDRVNTNLINNENQLISNIYMYTNGYSNTIQCITWADIETLINSSVAYKPKKNIRVPSAIEDSSGSMYLGEVQLSTNGTFSILYASTYGGTSFSNITKGKVIFNMHYIYG